MRVEARAQLQPWSRDIEVALIQQCEDYYLCAEPVTMIERKAGLVVTPAFTLTSNAVQQLMDDLWRCGYRPSEGEGSAGQLASVKYHLEDMRSLVFNKK